MAVTESKGNGYALYNGVKLPNIDAVWTDKEKYPYAYLSRVRMQEGDEVMDGYYLTLSNTQAYADTVNFGGELWMVRTRSAVQQYFMDVNGSAYTLEMTSESTEIFTAIKCPASIIGEGQECNCLWANVDICGENDSTIYLPASSPIPLDGMNVIEWDGVTEGLEVFDGSYYRIADFSKASSGVVVVSFVKDEDMRGVTSFFIDDLGVADAWAIAKDSDSDPNAYGISETASAEIGVSAGIYAVGALLEGSIVFWAGLLAYTPATAEPEDVLDDTWPIEWNALEVANNTAISINGANIVKISNLIPDYTEFVDSSLLLIEPGAIEGIIYELERINNLDHMFSATYKYTVAGRTSHTFVYVFKTSGYDDFLGINVPETGIYYAVQDVDENFVAPADVNFTLSKVGAEPEKPDTPETPNPILRASNFMGQKVQMMFGGRRVKMIF